MGAQADFKPISDDAWPAELDDMLSGFAGGLNVHRAIAHHPPLLRALAGLREHVVNRNALGHALSEIAILRLGHRLGSSYEVEQHIVRGRARGLSDARISATSGPVEAMEPADAIVAQAVDDLVERNRLSEASIAALMAMGGKGAVMDLIATVGFYSLLGYSLLSFDTPLDDNIAAELAKQPLRS